MHNDNIRQAVKAIALTMVSLTACQSVWAGNTMPPAAPSRLKRPVNSAGDSVLSGSVTQTTLSQPRLSRPDSGLAPAVNQPVGRVGSTYDASTAGNTTDGAQGSLFSSGDKSAFAGAQAPAASSAPAPSSNYPSSFKITEADKSSELFSRGLKAVTELGRVMSQSPQLQEKAKSILKGLASGSGSTAGKAAAGTALKAGTAAGASSAALSAVRIPIVGKVLNKQELNLLANYEIAIVIDKSGSMNETDCPQGLSRWEWCRQQLLSFTSQISPVFKSGITVALFSSNAQVLRNVSFSLVPDIFSKNVPNGGTYMAKPLSEILDEYFERRDRNPASVRKLLIEVITDGEPSDKGELISLISRASRKMTRADEVRIDFLQIGNEEDGIEALRKLDTKLVGESGAQFDIVTVEPFSAVVAEGLPRALLDTASH